MTLKYVANKDNILSLELKELISKHLYKSIKAHKFPIYINGVEKKLYENIKQNDVITIDYVVEKESDWPLYPSDIEILYEDEDYLVVNKRRNLLSIPKVSEQKSLYQEILYYFSLKGKSPIISIITRLDKKTSGLVVVALNKVAASNLSPVHEKITRRYYALLDGVLQNDNGKIITHIKKEEDSIKRYVSDDGQIAISNYKAIKRYDDKTLVEFELETGRTHQIRVHSKYLGHPVLGDDLYADYDGDLYLTSHYVNFKNLKNETVEIDISSWWENEEK